MASMIDGDNDEISFDWDQAQKELLDEAGIDMAKEMECKLLTMAEEVILFLCFSLLVLSRLLFVSFFHPLKILEESHLQGQKLYRPKFFLLHEAKMIIEAYRREKQKAEVGAQDPAETSWKLIKAQVQKDDKLTVKSLLL